MSEIWESEDWPNFGYDAARVEPLLAGLSEAIGVVRGLHAGLSPAEREQILLREIASEAVHSFGIEGVTLDVADIEASVVASMADRNLRGAARRSDRIAEMMLQAREAVTLDAARLCDWHRMLFQGLEVDDLGQWRRSEMVIAKSARADREDILYKALPAAQVPDAMAKWIQGAADMRGRSVPVTAALLHLWFESIHPFSDGNGRIGRAVNEAIFARSGALPFSLSRQIEADKRGYYAALQAGRVQGDGCIDATEFVVWFLEALAKAAARGLDEALYLVGRNQYFARFGAGLSQRQRKVLERLFAQGQGRVDLGLSNKNYAKISGVSDATASRDLADLVNQGAVRRSAAGGRSTRYYLLMNPA